MKYPFVKIMTIMDSMNSMDIKIEGSCWEIKDYKKWNKISKN